MELIRSETFFRAFFVPYSWLELVSPAPEPTTTAGTERNMEERRAEEILSGEIKNFSSTTQSLCCCATQRRLLSYQRSTSMLSKYILDIYQETVFLIHKNILYKTKQTHTRAVYRTEEWICSALLVLCWYLRIGNGNRDWKTGGNQITIPESLYGLNRNTQQKELESVGCAMIHRRRVSLSSSSLLSGLVDFREIF